MQLYRLTKTLHYCFFLFFLVANCTTKEIIPQEKSILSFVFKNATTLAYVLQSASNSVEITVPYGTYLKNLTPLIRINDGVTIIPASGEEQDFTQPVYYTLVANDGSKAVYKVSVKQANQTQPQIIGFTKTTLEAGESVGVTGQNFGSFQLDNVVTLLDEKGSSKAVLIKSIDSTHIEITIPFTTSPGKYHVQVAVKKLVALSSNTIEIRYPTPQLTELIHKNLRQGDTLWISGQFIEPANYSYELLLNTDTYSLKSIEGESGKLAFIIPTSVLPASYDLRLRNTSEQKTSLPAFNQLHVYEGTKPYILKINNNKSAFAKGERVTFDVINFDSLPARFYQIQLISGSISYFQNGIYDDKKSQLYLDLPDNIGAGSYTLSLSLIDASAKKVYAIDRDEALVIH